MVKSFKESSEKETIQNQPLIWSRETSKGGNMMRATKEIIQNEKIDYKLAPFNIFKYNNKKLRQ